MVSRFRDRVPKRAGLISLVTDLTARPRRSSDRGCRALAGARPNGKNDHRRIRDAHKLRREIRWRCLELSQRRSTAAAASRASGLLAKTDGRTKTAPMWLRLPELQWPPPPPPAQAIAIETPLPSSLATQVARQTSTAQNQRKLNPRDENSAGFSERSDR